MKDVIYDKYNSFHPKVNVLDQGFVELIDCMPRNIHKREWSADHAIAEAARCSYARGFKTYEDDKILIRYLMRHNHTSPFEMVEFKFHCKMPMFVARQWIRHRTASVNELSGRYSELPTEYYLPRMDNFRTQDTVNKQGSAGHMHVDKATDIHKMMEMSATSDFLFYQQFLEMGLTREQARTSLPLSTYTEWYWKINLKNLLHFLDLRCDSHSQWEIQEYGNAILGLITPIVPWTIEAWEDYSPYRDGMILTKYEVEKIRSIIHKVPSLHYVPLGEEANLFEDIEVPSKLEQGEWQEKAEKLGFRTYS